MKKTRHIVAIDARRGMADDKGIPWDLSIDKKYFRDKTKGSNILMGYNTYREFESPLPDRTNYVVCARDTLLRDGFKRVEDPDKFIMKHTEDLWIIGGASLFDKTLDYAQELYITQIDHKFKCTKFYPEYHLDYELATRSPDHHQNGLTFRFEIWRRKSHELRTISSI